MGDRDSWCTPKWITKRLPLVDLDPCSNPRSTVRARRRLMLENGENGLLSSWRELSVFCNPPYSKIEPWAAKIVEAKSFCFLVNVDPSTEWWRMLTRWSDHLFLFYKRIKFRAPPGVESSSNDRAQCFICDSAFRNQIGNAFVGKGQWWSCVSNTGVVFQTQREIQ